MTDERLQDRIDARNMLRVTHRRCPATPRGSVTENSDGYQVHYLRLLSKFVH